MKKNLLGALAITTALSPLAAMAQTEVQFWHAFTGRLGELVKAQVEEFNASQDEFVVVESHKGNYSETLNAGIAAFRAGDAEGETRAVAGEGQPGVLDTGGGHHVESVAARGSK